MGQFKGIVIIHGLPGTGKLDYARETDWNNRYKEYEFTNISIANIEYPELDFNEIVKNGVQLLIIINSDWIVDRTALEEILLDAKNFGYELIEEIFVEDNYNCSENNIKNKWVKQVSYKNYLLNKSLYMSEEYAKDDRSSIENGAWTAKEKYNDQT